MDSRFLLWWILLLPLSLALVWFSKNSLQDFDQAAEPIVLEHSSSKVFATLPKAADDLFDYQNHVFDCAEKGDLPISDWLDACKPEAKTDVENSPTNGMVLIDVIFVLLAMAFNSQLALLLYLIFSSQHVSRLINDKDIRVRGFVYISEWAVNSAPVLGVLGTVLSFALMVGSSRFEVLHEIFNTYFFGAAITTILGGAIYVINLFLSIFILAKIPQWCIQETK